MTAFEFLFWLKDGADGIFPCLVPHSIERVKSKAGREIENDPRTEAEKNGEPTRSELRRWLKQQAVLINGQRPGPNDEVIFPINELVFFPNGKRKCTMR